MPKLMRILYTCILSLCVPLVLLRLAWRGLKNPAYWQHWPQRFGFKIPPRQQHPLIWIHAVSVGEVRAAQSLLEALMQQYIPEQIIITTTTPTGADTVKQLYPELTHYYLPYDLPCAIQRFINALRPKILLVMETEIWPNLFWVGKKNGMDIILVNARLSARSAARYAMLPTLTRQTLQQIDLIAAQSPMDATYFIALGASTDKIISIGNLKLDPPCVVPASTEIMALKQYFSARPIWIAASTHAGEETQILSAHRQILQTFGKCLLILTARHPERFATVAKLCAAQGFTTLTKTQQAPCQTSTQVYVLDVMGELATHYAVADVAFIGGSLIPHGGQNVVEAARLGVPIITGPYVHNFLSVNQSLQDIGAAVVVTDANTLANQVLHWLQSQKLRQNAGKAGQQWVEKSSGSIDKLMRQLQQYLPALAEQK